MESLQFLMSMESCSGGCVYYMKRLGTSRISIISSKVLVKLSIAKVILEAAIRKSLNFQRYMHTLTLRFSIADYSQDPVRSATFID